MAVTYINKRPKSEEHHAEIQENKSLIENAKGMITAYLQLLKLEAKVGASNILAVIVILVFAAFLAIFMLASLMLTIAYGIQSLTGMPDWAIFGIITLFFILLIVIIFLLKKKIQGMLFKLFTNLLEQ
jgi:uncharacterized membrane protein YqjE